MLLALSVLGGHRAESVVVVASSSASESSLGSLALRSNTCDSVAGDVFNDFPSTSVVVVVVTFVKLLFGSSVLLLFHTRCLSPLTLLRLVVQLLVFPSALPVFLLPKL